MGWLSGYAYRKKVTISGSSGAGENYQVKLSIGSSSGGDFHLEGHCEDFPNDIRFTDDDGTTLLDYWIEDSSQDPITVWIKVKDSLDNNVDIYIYYGNPSATSGSDGDATFEFFDDFEGTSLDSDKWTTRQGSIGVDGNGNLLLEGTSGTRGIIDGNTSFSIGSALRVKAKCSQTDARFNHFCSMRKSGDWNYRGADTYVGSSNEDIYFLTANEGNTSSTNWTPNTPTDWHIYESTWRSGESKVFQDDNLKATLTSNIPTVDQVVVFYEGNVVNGNIHVDWVFVRKYVSPEPSFSSVGSEEKGYFTCSDMVSLLDESFGGGPITRSCTDILDSISSSSCFKFATWLPGFAYRKRLTISGSSGAGEGYQIKLKIGSSSGGDFHLNGHCDNFPNDIRFTKDDGLSPLSYWIEDPTQDPITVWVKIEDDLSNDVDVYCYYGSSLADSLSNGDATFEFFDDFSETSVVNYFASNGMYRPFMSASATYHNGKTFIVWQGTNGDPYAIEYNHTSHTFSSQYKVGDSPLVNDGHGGPALLRDGSGYLHVFYGSRGGGCSGENCYVQYAKSTNPDDITSWVDKGHIGPSRCTYPRPVLVGSDIYLFLFNNRYDKCVMLYIKSSDGGETWSSSKDIIDFGESYSIYYRNVELEGDSKIHIVWRIYDHNAGKRLHVYHAYLNLSDLHMYSMDGTDLGEVINKSEADEHCKVFDSGDNQTQMMKVHLDSDGTPYIIFSHDDNGWKFKFTKWNGSSWDSPITITTTDYFMNNLDFIVHSSSNIELYLTASGSSSGLGGDIEKWSWDGSSWTKIETILSEDDTDFPPNDPYIVQNFNPELKVVFSENKYDYSTPLKVFAYGDSGFVQSVEYNIDWDGKWQSEKQSYYDIIEENSNPVLRLKSVGSGWSDAIYSKSSFSDLKGFRYKVKFTTTDPCLYTGLAKDVPLSEWIFLFDCDNGLRYLSTSGSSTTIWNSVVANKWYEVIAIKKDTNTWHFELYEDGVEKVNEDRTNVTSESSKYLTLFRYDNADVAYADEFYVRKYADPEPSFNSTQAEEGPVFTCGDTLANLSRNWWAVHGSSFDIFSSSSLSSARIEFGPVCLDILNALDSPNSLLSMISRSQDSLGLIDSSASLIILLLNAVDSIDTSDGCTLSFSLTSSCLDVLHAIDSASYPLANVVSCLDSLGTQDSISSFLSMLCQSKDNIGGADGETSQLSVERALLDILAFQDTSAYLAGIIASASDILNTQGLNSVRLIFSCSSIDVVKNVDGGGVNVTFHLSGDDILKGADYVSGNLQVLLDSLAVFKNTDQSASSLLGFILRSASDVLDMYDLNTTTLQISSSSIDIFRTEDNSSINITFHLNSADVFKNSDSTILHLQALLSALETLKANDSSTASVFAEILASASDLLATSDYNTVRLEFLGSTIDIAESIDSVASNITLHLNSSDLFGGTDKVTAKLEALLSAISKFKSSDESQTHEVVYGVPIKIFKAQHKVLVFRAE